jgi:hypothetical protein
VIHQHIAKGEYLRLELHSDFRSLAGIGKEVDHFRIGQVGIQPRCGTLWDREPWRVDEGSGCGVILIQSDAAAAGWSIVAIKVAIAACAFHQIKNAIRNGVRIPVELLVHVNRGGAGSGSGSRRGAGSGANGQRALVVMLMTVEDNIHAVVFKQLGDCAHLAVDYGCIARGERRLMIDNNLPWLLAGIKVIDDPLPQSRWIGHECRRWRVVGISARQIVVEEMRVGIEEEDMGVAVVEGVVALVIY